MISRISIVVDLYLAQRPESPSWRILSMLRVDHTISNLLTLSAKRNCWGTLIVPESGVNDVVNHAESMQESYELQCEANARMISE